LSQRPIRFGTGGWRGVLGDEVTAPRVRALVEAVAQWWKHSSPHGEVLLAHDARPLGRVLLACALPALRRHQLRPFVVKSPVPTPVVTQAVARRGAVGALIFTASHNPASDHGIKVVGAWGGGLPRADQRRLEAGARRVLRKAALEPAERIPRSHDLIPDYLAQLSGSLCLPGPHCNDLTVYYDALHGAGSAVMPRLLRRTGVHVHALHVEATSRPEGAPDPSDARLAGLAAQIAARRGLRVGLATDGDADRFAALDETGSRLSEAEALALLVDHLAATGRLRGAVGLSQATGTLVARVAEAHGLDVVRLPMGFSHASLALRDGRVELAGDEGGGFAWARLGCDKDGILASALLVERIAARGKPLGIERRALRRRFGSFHFARDAVPGTPRVLERLAAQVDRPPTRILGNRVSGVQLGERQRSIRLELPDGFLMLRASGTETLVRVYAEGRSPTQLKRRLETGLRLLRGAQ